MSFLVNNGKFIRISGNKFAIGNGKVDISEATIESISDQSWTGSAITPELNISYENTQLIKDTDYTVSYSNNTNIGQASIVISGIGSYNGSKTINFNIVNASIDLPYFALPANAIDLTFIGR